MAELFALVVVLALAVALGLWIFAHPSILLVAIGGVLALFAIGALWSLLARLLDLDRDFSPGSPEPRLFHSELRAHDAVAEMLIRMRESFALPHVEIQVVSPPLPHSVVLRSDRKGGYPFALELFVEDSAGMHYVARVRLDPPTHLQRGGVGEISFGSLEELESWLRLKLEAHLRDPSDPWRAMNNGFLKQG